MNRVASSVGIAINLGGLAILAHCVASHFGPTPAN
jgi:hypothetical protein